MNVAVKSASLTVGLLPRFALAQQHTIRTSPLDAGKGLTRCGKLSKLHAQIVRKS